MAGDAYVLPVPEGSILVLRNVHLAPTDAGPDTDDQVQAELFHLVAEAVGHDRFIILHLDGDAEAITLTPDDALDRLAALLEVRAERKGHTEAVATDGQA